MGTSLKRLTATAAAMAGASAGVGTLALASPADAHVACAFMDTGQINTTAFTAHTGCLGRAGYAGFARYVGAGCHDVRMDYTADGTYHNGDRLITKCEGTGLSLIQGTVAHGIWKKISCFCVGVIDAYA